MVTIDAVRLWALDHERSLGHVVASTGVWGAYVHTACEQLGNFPVTEARPKRICQACRVALKTAHPSQERLDKGSRTVADLEADGCDGQR